MRLTPQQLAQFDRDGSLFFPGLFSAEETKVLTEAVPALHARREAWNVREKGSDAVRTNFAAHLYSAPFARLARHPRMVQPVMDLFGEAVSMHQFKRSTGRWRSRATSGSGTRTAAPGAPTT